MKNAIKIQILCFCTLLFFLLLTIDASAEMRLVILHSNDHHGHLTAVGELGGMARFATLVNQIRAQCKTENAEVLLLNAGDLNTGTPESDLFQARPDILAFNLLKCDFAVFGNHEFDPPFEKLEMQIQLATFPFGSANVFRADGRPLGTGWCVFQFAEGRVGVFGLTVANPNIIPNGEGKFEIRDELEAARKMVHFLREEQNVDLVIAVTHLGLVRDPGAKYISPDLAEQVSGIDLIVDGHSHTLMDAPLFVGGSRIVSSGEWSTHLGKAEFLIDAGKIRSFSWQCLPVTQDLPEDSAMKALLAPFIAEADLRLHETIAQAEEEFEGNNKIARSQETPLGDLTADSMVWTARQDGFPCDFAFINGGNVRAGLPKGNITQADIATAFPFLNEIRILELDGKTVMELFEFLGTLPAGVGAFPQFSREVHCVFDHRNPQTPKLLKVELDGQPIDLTKIYHVAVTDFMAQGGDGYDVLLKRINALNTSRILPTALGNYLKALPQPINPVQDQRLIILR